MPVLVVSALGAPAWGLVTLTVLMDVLLQVMDYGYPQFTEAQILAEYIKTDAYKMEVISGHSATLPGHIQYCC